MYHFCTYNIIGAFTFKNQENNILFTLWKKLLKVDDELNE